MHESSSRSNSKGALPNLPVGDFVLVANVGQQLRRQNSFLLDPVLEGLRTLPLHTRTRCRTLCMEK